MNALFSLTGKTAIVTGSTRGIGRAVAEAMIAAGAKDIISSESEADTARASAELAMPGIACDVCDGAQLAALVDFAIAQTGRLDVLVCNAGIPGKPGPFSAIDMDDFDRVMAINLRSQVVLCNLALPHIAAAGGGAAILMASIAGLRGNGKLERFPTNLAHRDGADFGRVQGLRREPCRCIVTDERRSNRPKGARPGGVDAGSPSDCVTLLGRATSPPCTRCLAERLPASITVSQIGRKAL